MVVSSPGRAQDYSTLYSDSVLAGAMPAFKEDMESLFATLRKHFTPEENRKLAHVRLEFPLREPDPLNFYSRTQDSVVCLPVQSKVFLSELILGYVWLVDSQYSPQTILDYVGMLGYYGRKSIADPQHRNYFGTRFPLPLNALQIPPAAAQNPGVAENRAQKLTDAIAFAFGHELGHLFYGHAPSASLAPIDSRAHETQADAFAVDILRRIPRAPLGTTFYFMMLAHFFGVQGEQPLDNRTHPLTAARLQALAQTLEQDAADFARNESNSAAWAADARALAGELRLAAGELNQALILHGIQVSNINSENFKERLAPRRSFAYEAPARPIDLLSVAPFSGVFDCDIRGEGGLDLKVRLILRRKADMVEGEYTYSALGISGHIHGNVENGKLPFNWNEPPSLGFPAKGGTGLLESPDDGRSISGHWGKGGNKTDQGNWTGTRVQSGGR